MNRPQNAVNRFRCPTCEAKRGRRCVGGRIHKARRTKSPAARVNSSLVSS